MNFFYIFAGIAIPIIIIASWIILTEKQEAETNDIQKIEPEHITEKITPDLTPLNTKANIPKSSSDITDQNIEKLLGTDITKKKGFLSKVLKKEKSDDLFETSPKKNDFKNKNIFNEELSLDNFNTQNKEETSSNNDNNFNGTATLKTIPVEKDTQSKNNLENNDKTENLKNLEEKYSKLEKLFEEKNTKLENSQKSLNNELGHRKEFDKIKQLLETEVIELKEKNRDLQVKINTLQSKENNNDKTSQSEKPPITSEKKEIKNKETPDLTSIDFSSIDINLTPEKNNNTKEIKKQENPEIIDLSNTAKKPKAFPIEEEHKNISSNDDDNQNDEPELDLSNIEPPEKNHEVHLMPDPINENENQKENQTKNKNIQEL